MSNNCHLIDCTERDFLIKQLKEQLYQYECKDRDYNELYSSYRHLQNEYFYIIKL
jgi:hypothetical protein